MKTKQTTNFHGVGRRKQAVARVWMKTGKGSIVINGKDYKDYFDTDMSRLKVEMPFKITGLGKNIDVKVNMQGG